MERDARTIKCGTHGSVGQAFVCSHLALEKEKSLGFFEPQFDPDDPEPQAWCGDCEKALNELGDWTDELTKEADIRLVCEFCFETIRGIHAVTA
jgi:hypothetical protein